MVEKLEHIVFRFRLFILLGFAAFTIYCGYFAFGLRLTAGFEKQLPIAH